MINSARRWVSATTEHEAVVRSLSELCRQIPSSLWHRSPRPGKWSPSSVVLHVCQSYELGRDAVVKGRTMRLRVSPARARVSRVLLLPVMLAAKRFPRGAESPNEVVPNEAVAKRLGREAAAQRLRLAADEALAALRQAAELRPAPQIIHAYFGELAPYTALRLLSAHTRHHLRGLSRLTR